MYGKGKIYYVAVNHEYIFPIVHNSRRTDVFKFKSNIKGTFSQVWHGREVLWFGSEKMKRVWTKMSVIVVLRKFIKKFENIYVCFLRKELAKSFENDKKMLKSRNFLSFINQDPFLSFRSLKDIFSIIYN